jgi:hypothetical protein
LIKLYGKDDEYDLDLDHDGRSTVGTTSARRPTDNEAAESFRDVIVEVVYTAYGMGSSFYMQ